MAANKTTTAYKSGVAAQVKVAARRGARDLKAHEAFGGFDVGPRSFEPAPDRAHPPACPAVLYSVGVPVLSVVSV